MSKRKVLIVDQDEEIRKIVRHSLHKNHYQIFTAAEQEEALALVKRRLPDLIVLNLHMTGIRGVELLQAMKDIHREARIVVLSGRNGDDSGSLASELGVDACFVKPLNAQKFSLILHKTLSEGASAVGRFEHDMIVRPIIGESEQLKMVLAMVKKVANSPATVLLQGPSGTGKESIARAIHYHSPRRSKPFLSINCAALPDGLLESELFGVCQGAYTGATANRPGKMQLADGGTLVLDEISEIPLSIQAKLLRAIQEKEVIMLGGGYPQRVDVRFVAVTNQDLAQKVIEGKFREDLFFRLNVFGIKLPSLNERQGDIPLLAEHFLRQFSSENNKTIKGFTPDTMKILQSYPWPGNIRELQNVVERAVILCDGEYIQKEEIPANLQPGSKSASTGIAIPMKTVHHVN